MNSMTGFGRAELSGSFGRLTVEISSVNSRFLETVARVPRGVAALEPQVRELVNSNLQRGKVSVFVGLTEPELTAGQAIINRKLAKAYCEQLRKLQKELKLGGEISVHDLLMIPELALPEKQETDLDLVWTGVKKATEKALKQMLAMRAREGKALGADMLNRLKSMARIMSEIEKATEGATAKYAEKLQARIEELLNGKGRDSVRLEEEIAIFADRSDITEECIRFRSHLDQFQATLKSKEPVGRKLNFILQEMNREANTIGSKGSDFEISAKVISLKEELEKIREQVQNVE